MDEPTLTITAAGWNALTTILTCLLIMLIQGFRSKEDTFDLIGWAIDNRNRFLVGVLITLIFSSLTILTPDLTKLLQTVGFNIDAKVPLSLGLALAAFLLGGVSKNKPL